MNGKILKIHLIEIAFIIFINLLTWLFIGRNSIIVEPMKEFRLPRACADTLIIPKRIEFDEFTFKSHFRYNCYSFIDDFSGKYDSLFWNEVDKHLYKDFIILPVNDYSAFGGRPYLRRNKVSYEISIMRVVPFYSYVIRDYRAGEDSMGYISVYIWFFHWFKIKDYSPWVV